MRSSHNFSIVVPTYVTEQW